MTFLLGGLLLLLLLLATLGRCSAVVSCGRCWGLFFLLLLLLLLTTAGDKESNHSLALNEAIVLDLAEDVVNLSLGKLVAKVHQCVAEHLGLDLAIDLVGLESAHDQVVRIIGTSSHLFLEHLDHVVECASTSDLAQHVVEFSLR